MATHRLPIIDWHAKPDTSGNVWATSYDEFATNDVWDHLVIAFADTASRKGLAGGFNVPKNYVGTASIIVVWTATAITGNVVWDFDYRAVGGNDAESLDQAGTQESVTVTDAAPGAAHRRMEVALSLTGTNLTPDDHVTFEFFRDGADVADTMAATALLFDLFFQYSDA